MIVTLCTGLLDYYISLPSKTSTKQRFDIIKSLQSVLCSSEAILQRLILRVLSFLCIGNQSFRSNVLHCSSLVARLPVCLASGDNDIVHWAVVLLHDLILSEGL